jgi:putative membrane protein
MNLNAVSAKLERFFIEGCSGADPDTPWRKPVRSHSFSGLGAAAVALSLTACATPPADPSAPARLMATADMARSQVSPADRTAALAGAQPMMGVSDAQYIQMAAASDLFEIQSSRMALDRARDPMTKQYAQMLIDHHTTSTQALMQKVMQAGMTMPPPALTPEQRAMMDRLRAAPAGQFDRAYFTEQVPAHRMAWQLHQGYAQSGMTPPLKEAATTVVPVVEQHLVEAHKHTMMH